MAPTILLAERPTTAPLNLTVVADANKGTPPADTPPADPPAADTQIPETSQGQGHNPWQMDLATLNGVIAKLGLPDNQAAALRWVRDFGFRNRKSLGEVARLLDYDKNTLYKILTGRHGAKLDSFTQEVEAFRAKVERSATKGFPFTETETGARIKTWCDLAISSGRIGFIVGRSHCGKTVNLVEYPKRHAYGKVNTVRMVSGGQSHQFKMRLANVKAVPEDSRCGSLSERLIEAFRYDTALIIDEFQECAPDGEKPRARTISYVREIHDMTGLPIVLALHEEAFDRIQQQRHAQLFKPLRNRALDPFYLPAEPTLADRHAYAAKLGLPPATGAALALESTVITEKSLGSWLTLLLRGEANAKQRGEPLSWEHVLRADRLLAKEGRK